MEFFRKQILYDYLCRTMDPDADAEWNELMEYDWAGADEGATHSAEADSAEVDVHILDADFEEDDEPVILTPLPAPPPAAVPTPTTPTSATGSSPQRSPAKVNENDQFQTVDPREEIYDPFSGGSESDLTDFSNITSYSRYGIRIKPKQGETLIFHEPEKPNMTSEYHQCKAARAASLSFPTTAVTFDENIGKTDTVKFSPLSSLDCMGDTEILKTFRGSRMNSGNKVVNQNISLSFDPSTLSCMSCEKPHNILSKGNLDGTPVLVFADQNFVPTLSGGNSCVAIARLENGSIGEIADLAVEILERHPIPPGTVILLGSVTHLQNVGTTIFATDWCDTIDMLRTKLRNVKIIPGIPILREDGPGSLGKQLVELTYWFKSVYEKNTLGCLPVWDKLLECISKTDEDGLDLGYTEFYTVALPISLTPKSDLTPVKFKFSSSHTTIRGIDCEASHELLCTLLDLLQKEFASVANSDEILSREPAPQVPSAKVLTHCIVIGGSNMKNLCPYLNKLGITVLDLSQSGWVPTADNIKKLAEKLKEIPDISNIPVIMDLLGNVAFRYEQLDGNLALPFKFGGKYHFGGKVLVCEHATLKNLIRSLKPVLDVILGDAVFCSPYPRCLYNGCCMEQDHCPGVDTEEYVKKLLQDTLDLRPVCQNMLSEMGYSKIWVPDTIHKMLPACNNNSEIAVGLKHIVAADGVHFTPSGYEKMAVVLHQYMRKQMCDTPTASVSILSGPGVSGGKPKKNFYWRGFASPAGSCRPKPQNSAYRMSHPGGGGKWKGHPTNVGSVHVGRLPFENASRGKNANVFQGGRGRGAGSRPPPPYYRRN
jgi:hypothetical protein